MKWYWLIPLIFFSWLGAGIIAALLIGPVLARNSQGPQIPGGDEKEGGA